MNEYNIPRAIELIDAAKHIAVLTGAGMSAESGIPTFRDALTGLWENYDPEDLACRRAFTQDKELVWGWYEWRRMKALQAQPNAGHLALAELAKRKEVTIITQNVDDLHERAGSPVIHHLHGSLHHPICFACARPWVPLPGIPDEPEGGRRICPPRCGHCRGYIRPGVVWFGEDLPQREWARSVNAVLKSDVVLAIGTSGIVRPAADLPLMASSRGTTVIVVNPKMSQHDKLSLCVRGTAAEALPLICGSTSN